MYELDRVAGSASSFGLQIRTELCGQHFDRFTDQWREVSKRILRDSPGAHNPTSLMATLCILAASRLYSEDRISAQETQ
jgi:hypothetical protein